MRARKVGRWGPVPAAALPSPHPSIRRWRASAEASARSRRGPRERLTARRVRRRQRCHSQPRHVCPCTPGDQKGISASAAVEYHLLLRCRGDDNHGHGPPPLSPANAEYRMHAARSLPANDQGQCTCGPLFFLPSHSSDAQHRATAKKAGSHGPTGRGLRSRSKRMLTN